MLSKTDFKNASKNQPSEKVEKGGGRSAYTFLGGILESFFDQKVDQKVDAEMDAEKVISLKKTRCKNCVRI